jgi:peptidoglycan/LPS O-acetylase OafA/YrhL
MVGGALVGDSRASEPASDSRRIPSLDGIRAVSFLLVFVSHAGLGNYIPGGMGVTIFFFLSGFLITTLLRAEYAKSGTLNLKNFWLRRLYRIWPPFYLVLLVAALVDPHTQWEALRAQLLHWTNYYMIAHADTGMPSGTGVYWSLSVEEHFYLLFPWVFLAMQRLSGRNQAFALYAICGVVLLWRLVLVLHFHVPSDRTYMGTDTRIDSIMFGCALAVWNSPVRDRVPLEEWRWKWLYVPAAAFVLVFCLTVRNEAFRETLRYTLQGVALTAFFIAAVRFPKWRPMQLLNSRPMVYVGLISYSMYLLHFSVIFGVRKELPNFNQIEQGVVALAVSIALSASIYRIVEQPFARLRHKLSADAGPDGRKRGRGSATA